MKEAGSSIEESASFNFYDIFESFYKFLSEFSYLILNFLS